MSIIFNSLPAVLAMSQQGANGKVMGTREEKSSLRSRFRQNKAWRTMVIHSIYESVSTQLPH
jgi:hypothetical protein